MVLDSLLPKKRFSVSLKNRKVLVDTYYVDNLNTSVCLELALNEDLQVIEDYLYNIYGDRKGNNCENEESVTIIARDDLYICALLSGTVFERKNMKESSAIFQHLPAEVDRLFHIRVLNFDEGYQGSGLGTKIWAQCLQLAIRLECQYVTRICPLGLPMIVASKMGMRLKNFNLNEMCQKSHLMVYDLSEASDILACDQMIKVPEAYRLKEAKRQLIHSSFVKKLGREVKMELALLEDIHVLHNYAINEFFKQTPLFVSLGFQKEDAIELTKLRLSPQVIEDGRVIIITDDSKLVGIMICRDFVVDRCEQKYDLELTEKIDLTEEIDSQPNTQLPIAKYKSVVKLINEQMSFCVPEGVKNFAVFQMVHLNPSYRHCKLGFELVTSGLMLAHSKGYRFVQTMTTSMASDKQSGTSIAKRSFSCLFDKFMYKGAPIFPNGELLDGLKRASIFQIDMETL